MAGQYGCHLELMYGCLYLFDKDIALFIWAYQPIWHNSIGSIKSMSWPMVDRGSAQEIVSIFTIPYGDTHFSFNYNRLEAFYTLWFVSYWVFLFRSSDAGPMDDRSPCKGKVAISGTFAKKNSGCRDYFNLHNEKIYTAVQNLG